MPGAPDGSVASKTSRFSRPSDSLRALRERHQQEDEKRQQAERNCTCVDGSRRSSCSQVLQRIVKRFFFYKSAEPSRRLRTRNFACRGRFVRRR
ncbi:MAG: hypothetical protein BJ554DRAFT_4892 [Olpidium bornovanus]|uniref:Uncharacterized protein n=1 Tax=Olpidium bornovanus TaxID=278681 RepID=A0A8H8A037_9FUNG|nr:MAG: hypothetical protein BJ554DRAFT_4892 [Olpidium bornovanus]